MGWFVIVLPLFGIASTIIMVAWYANWSRKVLKPWLTKDREMQEIEDYANEEHKRRRKHD